MTSRKSMDQTRLDEMDSTTSLDGHNGHVGERAKIGILVASDRAYSKEYEDEGGPAILGFLKEAVASPVEVHYRCIPCLLYTSPSPRDMRRSRMPSSA